MPSTTARVQHPPETRRRVLMAYENGEDWVHMSQILDINSRTAKSWIRRSNCSPSQFSHGGLRYKKLEQSEVEEMCLWIAENPTITLKMIQLRLKAEYDKDVCVATVGNYLDGQLITVKKLHTIAETMNSQLNKEKRKRYVLDLQWLQIQGKKIIWIDESNINLYCTRNFGRSLKGTRVRVPVANSRGPNLHMIGAISIDGLVNFTIKRGSFTAEVCKQWMDVWLSDLVNNSNDEYVIVCDNAPCHSRLEDVCNRERVQLLRLGPYSPALNPIEMIWSVLKSHIKTELRDSHQIMLNGDPTGVLSQHEWRFRFLENLAISAKAHITLDICVNAIRHVQQSYETVLRMEDL